MIEDSLLKSNFIISPTVPLYKCRSILLPNGSSISVLNLIKESWKPFAKLEIQTPGFEKTIKWGKRRHDEPKEDR